MFDPTPDIIMGKASESPGIRKTGDGSTTLYSSRFGQHYHNPNGAVAESRHIFFEHSGLLNALKKQKEMNILEVGFGTGLNLLLLLDYHLELESESVIHFYSVEAFPVDAETALKFEFGNNPGLNNQKPLLNTIFKNLKPGINRFVLSDKVTLHLFHGFFDNFFDNVNHIKPIQFVFHDPFSPEVNPELWTPDVFKKIATVCSSTAVLSTYCAASSARAAMAVAGWNVARAKGALGKREMTVASLSEDKLSPFKRVNEKRLVKRFEQGDFNSNRYS